MELGSSKWDWYDIIIVGLSALIVYPDKVLDFVSNLTGRAYGVWHVVLVEGVAIALIYVTMSSLIPAYPHLEWWIPLLWMSMLGLLRGARWLIIELFDFRDW